MISSGWAKSDKYFSLYAISVLRWSFWTISWPEKHARLKSNDLHTKMCSFLSLLQFVLVSGCSALRRIEMKNFLHTSSIPGCFEAVLLFPDTAHCINGVTFAGVRLYCFLSRTKEKESLKTKTQSRLLGCPENMMLLELTCWLSLKKDYFWVRKYIRILK